MHQACHAVSDYASTPTFKPFVGAYVKGYDVVNAVPAS